jgi:predicted  nucleic acid-binding Zn-ribbon protein
MSAKPLTDGDEPGDDLDGVRCSNCGAEFEHFDIRRQACPSCGDDELQLVVFTWCGRHWHTSVKDAGQCDDDRIEAARDAYWELKLDEAMGR